MVTLSVNLLYIEFSQSNCSKRSLPTVLISPLWLSVWISVCYDSTWLTSFHHATKVKIQTIINFDSISFPKGNSNNNINLSTNNNNNNTNNTRLVGWVDITEEMVKTREILTDYDRH